MASTSHVRSLPRPPIPDDLQGIPDVFITRCLCFGFAALFLAPAVILTVYFPTEPSDLDSPGMILLLGLLVLAIYGCAGYCVFAGTRAGRIWLRVDRTGVYAGRGIEPGNADEISMTWKDMAINRDLVYDVSASAPTGSRSVASYIRYWRRLPDGHLVERSLRLSLATSIRAIRFRNQDALQRAVLHHIANQPGLRIDGSLFVDAGFDPETWEPRKGPRRAIWLATAATLAATFGFGSITMEWPPLALGLGVLAVFIVSMLVTLSLWHSAYSDTDGIFVFRQQASAPAAPVVQHARQRTATPQTRNKTPRKRSRK